MEAMEFAISSIGCGNTALKLEKLPIEVGPWFAGIKR
jgi:hypothetical protein